MALWPGHLGNVAVLRGSSRPSFVTSLAVVSAVGAAAGCALLLLTSTRVFSVAVPFLVLGASALLAFQPRLRALLGPVHWVVALVVAPSSLAGGVLGGRLARRLSEPVLRVAVAGFGVLAGVWMGIRAFG